MQNKIDLFQSLSQLDFFIFFFILGLTIASVIYGQYRMKTSSEKETFLDLLIMGRRLTLPLFIATLVATWYGGIFGVTEIAFNQGIYNFVTQGVFWYLAYIIFALFLIKKIEPYRAITLPDLVGKMFGPKSAKLTAVFNFFNVIPIAYAISLGIFIQLIFGGTLVVNTAIGISFVVLYSMWGGIRSVVYSDLIQFFVMCLAVVLVLGFSIFEFGGLTFLKANLPDSYWSLTGKNSLATTFVWGFIALSTLVDPNFYQRCFSAVSGEVSKKGILISTVIWFCFDICTTFGAMYAKAVIPNTESSHAYLTYAIQILPNGLKGFMLAGIIATILSTLDSYLFIAGTNLAYDLAPKKFRGRIWIHHFGVIFVGILTVIMSVYFQGNIKSVWKTLGSFSAACLLLPVMYGHLFPKRITDNQFVTACIAGVIATATWRHIPKTCFYSNIDELYIGITATSLSLFLYHLIRDKKLVE